MNILDEYVKDTPRDQNALDLFEGEWSSELPGRWKTLRAGAIPLFEDPRMVWAAEQLGGLKGQRVIELGPLEAGHTYMLESTGAESILAIEGNKRAYLKCLIIKEVLGLQRSRFLLGDIVLFLRENTASFDVCLASGVLYHMQRPAELIHLISRASNTVILWTHYYDKRIIENNAVLAHRFSGSAEETYHGFTHVLHKYLYSEALGWGGFCGGSHSYSYWMSRDDILASLRFFDFDDLRIGFEQPDHPNGPSFCVVGVRSP
jgi:hypothetical protein